MRSRAEYGQAAGGVLNVITRSGANKLTAAAPTDSSATPTSTAPPFAGRYDANLNPVFLDETPPFDQQRYGGFVGGPLRTNRLFYFGGLERLQLDSSEVLGISDYWRQFVTDTIIPTGQRATVGIVKVDLNVE